jgi:hypothetical protein
MRQEQARRARGVGAPPLGETTRVSRERGPTAAVRLLPTTSLNSRVSDEPESPAPLHGRSARPDVELSVEALGVALDSVERDEHLGADLAL